MTPRRTKPRWRERGASTSVGHKHWEVQCKGFKILVHPNIHGVGLYVSCQGELNFGPIDLQGKPTVEDTHELGKNIVLEVLDSMMDQVKDVQDS